MTPARSDATRARLCEVHRVRVTYTAAEGRWMAWDETGQSAYGQTRAAAEDGVLDLIGAPHDAGDAAPTP